MNYSIAFDGDIFVRQQNGGISVHFYYLIKNLSKTRNVFVFYHSFNRSKVLRNYYFRQLLDNNSIVIREYSDIIELKRMTYAYKISIMAATYYSLAPLLLGIPTIYTFHDAAAIRYINKYFTASRTLAIIAQFITLNLATGISSISEYSMTELLRYYLFFPFMRKKAIRVTGNSSSLRLSEFNPKPKPNHKNQMIHLLYVGTRKNYKNFLSVLPAINKLQENFPCFLHICGGSDLSAIELESLYSNKIKFSFTKNPSTNQLQTAYQQADIFIHSSLYEGFGITILEALTHSLLTVAVKIPPVYHLAGDSIIYSSSGSSADLYSALHQAFTLLPDQRLALLESGYTKASEFTWDSVSIKFDALALSVLK